MKINREHLHAKYGGRCGYCGKEISVKNMQVDHIEPQVYGGTDELSNLMPACRDCNNYKNCWTIEQFREYVSEVYNFLSKSAKFRVAERLGVFERKSNKIKFYFENETI